MNECPGCGIEGTEDRLPLMFYCTNISCDILEFTTAGNKSIIMSEYKPPKPTVTKERE